MQLVFYSAKASVTLDHYDSGDSGDKSCDRVLTTVVTVNAFACKKDTKKNKVVSHLYLSYLSCTSMLQLTYNLTTTGTTIKRKWKSRIVNPSAIRFLDIAKSEPTKIALIVQNLVKSQYS